MTNRNYMTKMATWLCRQQVTVTGLGGAHAAGSPRMRHAPGWGSGHMAASAYRSCRKYLAGVTPVSLRNAATNALADS